MTAQPNIRTSERGPQPVGTQYGRAPSLARQAWEASHGDFDAATTRLMAMMQRDQKALKERMSAIFEQWCRDQVRAAAAQARHQSFHVAPARAAQGGRIRLMLSHALMDFPLVSGKLLRDATGEDCRDSASAYRATASDALWKARWLEAVAERVGDATVADVLDEAALAAIREETNAD